ncbi:hypothetical protein ABZ038_13465 [Streptomyces sp. NPDC006349]|uniref:hypothetical protein n=1 Tax=Streptomyces sp. NPDC006349 TaxID=3156757 RepID=UPI0033A95589
MPFEDRIRELKKVKEDRKIGAIGPNEVAVGQIIAALELVEIDSGQSQYSITRRQRDGELDPSRCDTDLCGVVDEGAVGLAWLLARAVDAVPVRLNMARITALTIHPAKTGSTPTGQPVP